MKAILKYILWLFILFGLPFCSFGQTDVEDFESTIEVEEDPDSWLKENEVQYKVKHPTPQKWAPNPNDPYLQEARTSTSGATKEWEKQKENLKFSHKQRKVKGSDYKTKPQNNNRFTGEKWAKGLQYLLLGLGFLLVIALFIYLAQGGSFRQGKKITVDISDAKLDWIEENLPEADVLSPLESAIQAKEYRKAIRLYFLLIVQRLSQAEEIDWQKEKTNRTYILETYNKKYHRDFKSCVRIYEHVWYGERQVKEDDFLKIEPVFKNLSEQLVTHPNPKNEE